MSGKIRISRGLGLAIAIPMMLLATASTQITVPFFKKYIDAFKSEHRADGKKNEPEVVANAVIAPKPIPLSSYKSIRIGPLASFYVSTDRQWQRPIENLSIDNIIEGIVPHAARFNSSPVKGYFILSDGSVWQRIQWINGPIWPPGLSVSLQKIGEKSYELSTQENEPQKATVEFIGYQVIGSP